MAVSAEANQRTALRFVLTIGVLSFFADFTYEGSRSLVGPFLATLQASGPQMTRSVQAREPVPREDTTALTAALRRSINVSSVIVRFTPTGGVAAPRSIVSATASRSCIGVAVSRQLDGISRFWIKGNLSRPRCGSRA